MYTIIIIIIVLTSWYFLSEKEEESTSSSSSAQNNKTERNLISSKNISKKATLLKSQYKLHFKTNITIYISEDFFLNPAIEKYAKLNEFINIASEVTNIYLIVELKEYTILEKNDKINLVQKSLEYYVKKSHFILFYTTSIGKNSIIRQVNPSLYIEQDLNTISAITFFIKKIILLCEKQDELMISDYDTIESFSELI